jgi:tetratricopeptide (TPR) repeat protein
MRFTAALFSCALALTAARTGAEEVGCGAPEPVCAARGRVFAVSSFAPVGSAVLLEPGLLVTGRHVVADRGRAEVFLPDGRVVGADVVPTVYPGDLVLLRATEPLGGRDDLPPIATAAAAREQDARYYAVGFDLAAGRVEVSPPRGVIRPSAPGRPLARLHHASRSLPGTGGGALVDAEGRLVGVLASLGEGGHNEAIPAADLAELRLLSGPPFKLDSDRIGRTYRSCMEALDRAREAGPDLDGPQALGLIRDCAATGNRQLFDATGRLLAMAGRIADARAMFEASLAQDPNAVDAMFGLAQTLHMALRFEEATPYLERLVELAPDEAQVLHLAVRAGKWGGDGALAERAVALLEVHHPELAPRAREFLNAAGGPTAAPPPPKEIWAHAAWLGEFRTEAAVLPRLSQ